MFENKILHVVDKLDFSSGVSSVIMNYYMYMDPLQYQFDFLLNEEPELEYIELLSQRGSSWFVMPSLHGNQILNYRRCVDQFLRENPYRILHGHIANAAGIYMPLAKKNEVSHRILHSHNSKGADSIYRRTRNRILSQHGVKSSNHFVACSDMAGEYLFGRQKMNAGKVFLLPNAIDLESYQFSKSIRQKIRCDFHLKSTDFIIGHIGRFEPQKNHFFIMDIMKKLLSVRPNSYLISIGDGSLKREVEEYATQLGIGEHILFLGIIPQVVDFFQAMDCFILPSLYEGLPVVGVEAQANGLPCLFSQGITKQVKVLDLVKFLTLEVSEWCSVLQNTPIREHSENVLESMSFFNIKVQSKNLASYYDGLKG